MADAERHSAGGWPPLQLPAPADAAVERNHRLRGAGRRTESAPLLCWRASGAEAAEGLKTVVTWTLAPVAGGVLLRMEQSGFRATEEANFRGANCGWQRFLGGLERVLADSRS